MKSTIALLMITGSLFIGVTAQAKLHKFSYAGGKLTLTENAESWKEAYEKAAHKCFNHFTGSKNRDKTKISRQVALDIIDICANPRHG